MRGRYELDTDLLVNRLVPHFLSGRRYILFLQSLVYPLYTLNRWFVGFAREKQIEARMTSQVIWFEWFLTRKFSRYFVDPEDKIVITQSEMLGIDLYGERSAYGRPYTVWQENELIETVNPAELPREMYFRAEEKLINRVSFVVNVPAVVMEERELVYMVSYWVNLYRVAGKTFLIRVDGKEV